MYKYISILKTKQITLQCLFLLLIKNFRVFLNIFISSIFYIKIYIDILDIFIKLKYQYFHPYI